MRRFSDDVSIVFGGAAGLGVQTIANALIPVLKKRGYHVFACHEYMSRIRGGCNTAEIRISGKKRRAYLKRIDLLFALDDAVVPHLLDRIGKDTLIFAETAQPGIPGGVTFIKAPFSEFALQAGNPAFSNTVAVGMVLGMLGMPVDTFTEYLEIEFARKGEDIVRKNMTAATLGHDFGSKTARETELELAIERSASVPHELLLDGTTALGIGAVAAGCNFIASYPMSPGTGLLTFLAARAERFGIVVEQSEDEIAAINTAIGAGYAGARAIVTTSGGGFDLMQEGISLAGMTETPVVIHLGQRPGPATGLPTRTEQGDLNLALHAGHGEFARAIFAPGTLEEAFALAQRAFELAGRFQMPVILLTDQYFLDAVSTMDSGNMQRLPSVHHIVKTGENYRRYSLTPDGVTPRGVPGYGDGTVRVDSDEHDEQGHITESFEIRRSMVEKRLKRIAAVAEEALMPSLIGPFEDAGTVIVAWGSNRGVLEEALEAAGNQTVSAMHFSQVFPLNPGVKTMLEGKNIVVLENNASGQFADILHRQTGHDIAGKILKTTGEPFSVEEVAAKIREL